MAKIKRNRTKSASAVLDTTPNFGLFAEYLNTYFTAVDENGLIHYVNSALAKALGYRQKEIIGRHMYQFILEYNSEGVFQWDRIEEVLANPGKVPIRAMELRCKNGGSLWIELRETLSLISDNNLRLSIGTHIDVTDVKKSSAKKKHLYDFHFVSAFMNNAVKKQYNFTEVFHYLSSIGIELSLPVVVIYFTTVFNNPFTTNSHAKNFEWKSGIVPIIHFSATDCRHVVWDTPQGLALLVSLSPVIDAYDQIESVITKMISQLQASENLTKTRLGVSAIWDRPGNVSSPVFEAEGSVHWGIIMAPDKNCHYWKNLGIGQLLLTLKPEQAIQFFSQKLGPLLTLPATNRNELLQTLCEILISSSVTDSANRMHVHPKTIAYRRASLAKLLNVDFDDPSERTELFIAMRLYQIHCKSEP